MLRWIVAIHDAFGLYGRPEAWTWDPRDPKGLMFGYPVGPARDVSCSLLSCFPPLFASLGVVALLCSTPLYFYLTRRVYVLVSLFTTH